MWEIREPNIIREFQSEILGHGGAAYFSLYEQYLVDYENMVPRLFAFTGERISHDVSRKQ